MSDITRKDLARGTKLTRDHVFDVYDDVSAELSSPSINDENLKACWVPFRVNLHIPWLDARYFQNKDSGNIRFAIPFTLPPLQEFFDGTNFLPDENTPQIVLDEFQVSFDQRSEASAIASRFQTAKVNAGKLFPDAVDRLDLSVSLLEKKQWITDNNIPAWPEQEIFSTNLPAELFSAPTLRINPFIVDELNKTMSPYRTYIVVLDGTDMFSTDEKVMLPALQFSLKMRAKALPRDTNAVNTQNLPTAHDGIQSGPTVTISTPNADTLITADGTRGLQTNLKTLDDVFHGKLRGGYTRDCDADPTESVSDDAGYDILCIPVWSGYGHEGIISAQYAPDVPNPGAAPYTAAQQDEVVVPLPWPMTIHHITLAVNYQAPTAGAGFALGGLHPTSATFTNTVSVGLGLGRQADTYTFQEVGTCSWTPANKAAITIDRVLGIRNSLATAETPSGATHYDWELLHCPLVTSPAGAGSGYYTQGGPFFAGQGTSKLWARSDVGSGDGSDKPFTKGSEQWIQVNWKFQDAGGLADNAAATPGAAGDPSEVYVGYMGHWVQIVGKKHLATINNEIPA